MNSKLMKELKKLDDVWHPAVEEFSELLIHLDNTEPSEKTEEEIDDFCRRNGISCRTGVSIMDAHVNLFSKQIDEETVLEIVIKAIEEATNFWIKKFDF